MAGENAVLVAVRSRPLLECDELINPGLKFSDQDREVVIQDKSFTFDFVFPPDSSNFHVYQTAVASRLDHIFNGYNLTIFAYGQTGSGKSHTMGTDCSSDSKGEKVDLGIIPLSVTDIFKVITNKGSSRFCVKVSFMEVYKEVVYDLLSTTGESSVCSIREDCEGVKVANLTESTVKSVDDVMNALKKGCNARRIGATALNEYSSRSHAIFVLVIEQNCGNFDTKKSKFQLIDLAGSERPERSGTAGVRFKEGVDINKGLLALGKVISGLCGEKSHIPYRDSKLTRLLMDSLGGNSYTLMIGCISPSLQSSEETLSTLRYASRARKIKNKPVVNFDPPEIQIAKLKRQVELLQSQLYRKVISMDGMPSIEDTSDVKQENEKLKEELNNSTGKIVAMSEKLIKAEENTRNLKEMLNSLCCDLRTYLLKHDSDESSPTLNKLFDHLKCLDYQDMLIQSPDLVVDDRSDSPEQEASDEDDDDDDVADLKGDEIKHKLGNIELDLLKKQEIISHFETISKVVDLSNCSQDDVNAMKNKIKELSQEKANLEEKLKASEKRITDEYERRYQECQREIKGIQKKIFKNELVHKIKAQHQIKMEKFQQEIKELKCTRVKLIKKMKNECGNFKKLQMAKERELAELKQNERKKEREIVVLRNTFDKQMNVYKQKMEKVQALNKRLNEAINKSKKVSLAKKQKVEKETLEEWINKELDVEIFSKLAAEHYNFAKENMSDLAEKVQEFQKVGDHSGSLQDLINLELEKLDAAKPLTKCLPGNRSERWSTINSMAEAKVAVEILFDKYVASHVESYLQNESRMSEVTTLKERLEMEIKMAADKTKNLNEEIKSLKEKLDVMKKDYERKLETEKCHRDITVIDCLKNMNDLEKDCVEEEKDSDLLKKIQAQEQEIQHLQERFAGYTKKCEEVEYWKEEYTKLKHSKKRKYLSEFPYQQESASSSMSSFTQQQDTACGSALFEYLEDVAEESFSSMPDSEDPDWRMTPKYKQRKRPLRETIVLDATREQDDDTFPSKRPAFGCKCPSDCRTMRCACRKKNQECGTSCSCNRDVCVNISSEGNM